MRIALGLWYGIVHTINLLIFFFVSIINSISERLYIRRYYSNLTGGPNNPNGNNDKDKQNGLKPEQKYMTTSNKIGLI